MVTAVTEAQSLRVLLYDNDWCVSNSFKKVRKRVDCSKKYSTDFSIKVYRHLSFFPNITATITRNTAGISRRQIRSNALPDLSHVYSLATCAGGTGAIAESLDGGLALDIGGLVGAMGLVLVLSWECNSIPSALSWCFGLCAS